MRQSSRSRLVLAAALLLSFLLLAAALNGFELASGLRIQPTIADTIDEAFESRNRSGRNYYEGTLLGWVVSMIVALAVVLFFIGLMKRENQLSTLMLVLLGAAATVLISRIPPPAEELETAFEEGSAAPGAGGEALPIQEVLPEEEAVDVDVDRPDGSSVLSWVLAGVALVGLVLVIRPRLPSLRRGRPDEEGETLGETARQAADRAARGEDVVETVVRCYRDMLDAYRRTRYAGRYTTLTPRELVGRLLEAGVPEDAARGLTDLFERARYGTVTLTSEEEARAIGHLRVIAAALEAQTEERRGA